MTRTLNYSKRIVLYDLTHIMNMADREAINVKTPRIDSGCSLEKEFTELICLNPSIVLYITVNQVNLFHHSVHGLLT